MALDVIFVSWVYCFANEEKNLVRIDDFGFDFNKISLFVLLRPAKISLMLWLYGNGSIKIAALFGSFRHTSQK